jgi:hypothetical protein
MIKKFLAYKLETRRLRKTFSAAHTNLPQESIAITASHKRPFRRRQKSAVTKMVSWLVITKMVPSLKSLMISFFFAFRLTSMINEIPTLEIKIGFPLPAPS